MLLETRLKLYVDYFFRRQDDCWKSEALQKLPTLKRATNMLICGEDLGMVPACVPEVIKRLGLLGLEIQRLGHALDFIVNLAHITSGSTQALRKSAC